MSKDGFDPLRDRYIQDYIMGFNNGFMVAAHAPDFARQLSEVKHTTPWLEGFRNGREEYILEKVKDLRPSWLNKYPSKDHEPDLTRDLDKDKEDKEPDVER